MLGRVEIHMTVLLEALGKIIGSYLIINKCKKRQKIIEEINCRVCGLLVMNNVMPSLAFFLLNMDLTQIHLTTVLKGK